MTLKFRKLTVNNFDLDTPDDSPVVLIHGENTLGKTQLFSALRWCLYGTFAPHQGLEDATRQLPNHLNLPAKRAGESSLEVSIDFVTDGSIYHLTRRASFFGNGDRVKVETDLRVDATVWATNDIDSEIGRVLHPQISEFFLFDAELLQRFYERLATERERALIKESIEAVLGIPALQLAQRDVQELANDALQRQAKLTENLGKSENIQRKLLKLSSDAESIEKDREELATNLMTAEEQARTTRDEMRVVEGLRADVREQETIEASLADGSAEEATLKREMKALLSSGWRSLAVKPLTNALREVQSRNSDAQKHNQRIGDLRTRVAVLEDSARGGTCPTCGQTLPEPGPQTVEALAKAREDLADLLASIGGGQIDLELERRLTTLVDEQTVPRYMEKHHDLVKLQLLQYERKQRLEGISDRLQGHSAADIRALAKRSKQIDDAIATIRDTQAKNAARSELVRKDQAKLARDLDKLPGSAGTSELYESGFYRFVDHVLRDTVEAYRENVRSEVQVNTQLMFQSLIRDPQGYGGLRIGSDYKVEILDNRGEPRSTSEGGKQLLALSLIGALKKAAVRGGPVVLDSPLGRLDQQHRANVLQTWIPELGAQAVLLVQSGELTKTEAQTLLGPLIGRSYEIVRPDQDPEYAVIEKA
jgi:DNA sulfur modification protein DndD